jgi:hypothetical protein
VPDVDVQRNEIYPQQALISLLDSDGDLAQASVDMSAYAAANSYFPPPDDFAACYGPDIILSYCISLATQFFFEDALVAWGELYEDVQGFGEGVGGTWIEPSNEVFA